MSPTCLIGALGERVLKAIRRVTRVGLSMVSTMGVALLVLFGCSGEARDVSQGEVVLAEYPRVDASFLAALEWRFVGPLRGGRVTAVAGDIDDPLVFYFGAAHGGVPESTTKHVQGIDSVDELDGYFERALVAASLKEMELDA